MIRHKAIVGWSPVVQGALGMADAAKDVVAGGASLTLGALTSLAKQAVHAAVAVPVGVGLGTGFAVSRMTSPSADNLKLQEQQIVNGRLQAMTEENIRKLASELSANSSAMR